MKGKKGVEGKLEEGKSNSCRRTDTDRHRRRRTETDRDGRRQTDRVTQTETDTDRDSYLAEGLSSSCGGGGAAG